MKTWEAVKEGVRASRGTGGQINLFNWRVVVLFGPCSWIQSADRWWEGNGRPITGNLALRLGRPQRYRSLGRTGHVQHGERSLPDRALAGEGLASIKGINREWLSWHFEPWGKGIPWGSLVSCLITKYYLVKKKETGFALMKMREPVWQVYQREKGQGLRFKHVCVLHAQCVCPPFAGEPDTRERHQRGWLSVCLCVWMWEPCLCLGIQGKQTSRSKRL